ncbi:hypothetical protein EJB05_04076, partial [Eragrostis curvula]
MDTASPSSPFVVVQSRVYIHQPPVVWGQRDKLGNEWAAVACDAKKAHGCGDHAQKLVEGITLYLRAVDYPDLTSALCIGLNADAAGSIEAELDAPRGGLEIKGALAVATRRLLVLLVMFRHRNHGDRCYYLIYDTTSESLDMVPYLPDHLKATYTLAAVPVDAADGHELAIMAQKFGIGRAVDRDRLCVCTPATRANPAASGAWRVEALRFPELPQPFSADETFSLGGMAFWADLSQGLVYCDLLDEGSVVDARFIELPDGYVVNYPYKPDSDRKEPETRRMTRTIGCAGSSVKFVCIDRRWALPGHETVKVWTLDLPRRRWVRDEGFPCPWKEFWKHVGFMDAKLGDVEPQFPTLMPDGALCLLLRWRNRVWGQRETCYICSFDIRSKRPVWFGLVYDYCNIGPCIVPCNFFTKCSLPSPSERKLPKILKQLPKRRPEHEADNDLHVINMSCSTVNDTKITACCDTDISKCTTAARATKGKEKYVIPAKRHK